MKLMKRHLHLLTALCAPYATLLMIRQSHNYKYGLLQVRGRDTVERRILNYEKLMEWVETGYLVRMVAPQERYEITPEGRGVVALQEDPEPEAPRYKWLQYGAQAKKALGR